jgi:hypothetical protein
MLFQQQVVNASFVPRRLNVGFHAHATQALEQIDMETCHDLVATRCLFQSVKNCTPQNMSLET